MLSYEFKMIFLKVREVGKEKTLSKEWGNILLNTTESN